MTDRTLATMTPAEIDTVLARIWGDMENTKLAIGRLKKAAKDRRTGAYRYGRTVEEIEADITELEVKLADLEAEAGPFNAEFFRRGTWLRYFLVTNGNGHVHRGMDCTTCYPTTQYAWLIDLADCDEGAMIEEWGEKACTVCFPTAPTNPFYNRPSRLDREARAARDAEKTKREADKNEKAITDVDGSPLRVDGSIIRTKVAARNELSGAVKSLAMYGPGHPSDFLTQIRTLIPALEAAGIETAPVIARAVKTSAKENWNHAGQVMDMIAGTPLTEAIESGNDLRLVPAVEKLGATVVHKPSPYGPWFRVTFPVGPREAFNMAMGAAIDEEDPNVAALLRDLARQLVSQAEGLERSA